MTALRLFAVLLEDFDELPLVDPRKHFGSRFARTRVEPQIERPFGGKAEAAGPVGQLIRGEPQVEQDAIDRGDREAGQHLFKFGITGLMEMTGGAREFAGGNFQHQGVAVKTD